MISLARKIVDAVHDSLLDGLVGKLLPGLLMILLSSQSLWRNEPPTDLPAWLQDGRFGLTVLCLVPAFAFLAWLIGVLANRRPHPGEPATHNGFDAWRRPVRPLHPPIFMRRLVGVVGRGRTGVTVLTVIALGTALLFLPIWPGALDRLWPDHPPPVDVWLMGVATLVAAHIRLWAVDARTRLAAEADR